MGRRMQSSLISKIAKARIYAAEPERVSIDSLACEVQGDNASHSVALSDGCWRCDCGFFGDYGTCSHAMALERILSGMVAAG